VQSVLGSIKNKQKGAIHKKLAGRGGVKIVKVLDKPTCLKNNRTCIPFCKTIPKKEDV